MDMLPTRPVIAPMVVEKVNADIPLGINTSQSIPVNQVFLFYLLSRFSDLYLERNCDHPTAALILSIWQQREHELCRSQSYHGNVPQEREYA